MCLYWSEERSPQVCIAVVVFRSDLQVLIVSHLSVHLQDQLGQDDGAHVVGEQVQQHPVSEHEPVGHIIKYVFKTLLKEQDYYKITLNTSQFYLSLHFPLSESSLDHQTESSRTQNKNQMIDSVESSDHSEYHHPEPDEHIDLLVDHVDWKHAESIVILLGA